MNGQSCGTCRCYKLYDQDRPHGDYAGYCRRYPPTVPTRHDDEGGVVETSWPEMDPDGWCGEYCSANPQTVSEGAAYLARLVILGDRTAAYALVDKLIEERPTEATDGPTE